MPIRLRITWRNRISFKSPNGVALIHLASCAFAPEFAVQRALKLFTQKGYLLSPFASAHRQSLSVSQARKSEPRYSEAPCNAIRAANAILFPTLEGENMANSSPRYTNSKQPMVCRLLAQNFSFWLLLAYSITNVSPASSNLVSSGGRDKPSSERSQVTVGVSRVHRYTQPSGSLIAALNRVLHYF
jgi:hypothetical protein